MNNGDNVKPAEASAECWTCRDPRVAAFADLIMLMDEKAPGSCVRDSLKSLKRLGFRVTLIYPEGGDQ